MKRIDGNWQHYAVLLLVPGHSFLIPSLSPAGFICLHRGNRLLSVSPPPHQCVFPYTGLLFSLAHANVQLLIQPLAQSQFSLLVSAPSPTQPMFYSPPASLMRSLARSLSNASIIPGLVQSARLTAACHLANDGWWRGRMATSPDDAIEAGHFRCQRLFCLSFEWLTTAC